MSLKDIQLKHDISEQDEITFKDNDLFDLEPFAENLRFLFDSPMPLTIIIDGGWGTGKTVFAKQLKSMMGDRANYINAFAHDYQDDVFTALLLDVKQAVDPDEKFEEPFINLFLHHIASNSLNELTKKMTGGIINPKQLDEAKKATNAYIENVKKRQEMLDNFRIALERHMEEKQPVVILVDELDRCKPKYALQVIEIIKHLYSVPKIHFVLIMNTKQIINTIRNEHGCNEEEAKIYLQKFYDLMISLPSIDYSSSNNTHISRRNIKKYIDLKFNEMAEKLHRYSPKLIDKWKQTHFSQGFADLAYNQNLSLREIDKILLKISIMACSCQDLLHIYLFSFLLLIHLREPLLFTRILNYHKNSYHHKYDEAYFSMSKDIHKFLNIDSITNHEARKDWDTILNRNWRTNDDAFAFMSEYELSPVKYIEYLNFLTPFFPPEK